MRNRILLWCAPSLLFGSILPAEAGKMIVCGADEVFVIDQESPEKKLWTWTAKDSPSIPEEMRKTFRSTDDCKPYAENRLLITSSSGGVALIDRQTKRCLFLAQCRNAHSACLLPEDVIVVASSFGGDALEFFKSNSDQKPAVKKHTIPLKGAHGVVWDPVRRCLWALGESELLRLEIQVSAYDPCRWVVQSRYKLPSNGGHDLSFGDDDFAMYVTTDTEVLSFDRNVRTFVEQAGFGETLKVKSVDQHPKTGEIVFHRASKENWWSDTIRFVDGDPIRLPNERIYKVRWDSPTPLPKKAKVGLTIPK